MLDAIAAHGMFHSEGENRGLWNFHESKQANSEQTHDLLQFRSIGQAAFEDYVHSKGMFLIQTSAKSPDRCQWVTIQGNKEYQHRIPTTAIYTSFHNHPGTSFWVDSGCCDP